MIVSYAYFGSGFCDICYSLNVFFLLQSGAHVLFMFTLLSNISLSLKLVLENPQTYFKAHMKTNFISKVLIFNFKIDVEMQTL